MLECAEYLFINHSIITFADDIYGLEFDTKEYYSPKYAIDL